MILEACVSNLQDAQTAEKNGAHQLELCDRLDLDGTTPPYELVASVLEAVRIPVKVILNPCPFEYCYDARQLQSIVDLAERFQHLGVVGVVFGPLTNRQQPDVQALTRMADSINLPITFHKAIDQTPDLIASLSQLLDSNLIQAVLSSGGQATALDGLKTLLRMKQLILQRNSNVQLIAAGKITADNLTELHRRLGLNSYHGKRIV